MFDVSQNRLTRLRLTCGASLPVPGPDANAENPSRRKHRQAPPAAPHPIARSKNLLAPAAVSVRAFTGQLQAVPGPLTDEEKISVVPADRSLPAAAMALRIREARRSQIKQTDWLMRQQLASPYASGARPACSYEADCGFGGTSYPSYPTFVITRTPRHAVPARHQRHVSVFR